MARWGVAALADEPGGLIAAFAGHHLSLGAAEVHVMLDRPNPEARDLLAGVPGVVLTEAGADGWRYRDIGRRPARHLSRQKYHASRVLAESGLDWVVHCDVDEFILPMRRFWLGEARVAAVLDRVPETADWLKIDVAERVWRAGGPRGLFDGPFRLPWPDFERQGRKVYDDAAMFLLHRGLCGHTLGKAAARAGRGAFLGVHQPMRGYDGSGKDLPRATTDRLRLLHFDGLTPLHYALKMVRRALTDQGASPPPHADHRRMQFAALAEVAADPALMLEQWRAAKTITAAQAGDMARAGVLADWRPRIPERAARALGRSLDLTQVGFDRALLARETDLIDAARAAFGFDPGPLVAAEI